MRDQQRRVVLGQFQLCRLAFAPVWGPAIVSAPRLHCHQFTVIPQEALERGPEHQLHCCGDCSAPGPNGLVDRVVCLRHGIYVPVRPESKKCPSGKCHSFDPPVFKERVDRFLSYYRHHLLLRLCSSLWHAPPYEPVQQLRNLLWSLLR